MKISKYRLAPHLSASIVVIGALVVLLSCSPPPSHLTIATSTPGGTYDIIGTELARILGRLPEPRFDSVVARSTAGSFENIRLLASDSVELALVANSALVAVKDSLQDIRVVAVLYSDEMQVIVSKASGVERLQDLEGKRVYLGKDESGNRTVALEMLGSVGIESTALERMRSDNENDSYQDASRKLIEGSLDAGFFLGGTPVAAVDNAMATGRFELLDLSSDMDALQSAISVFWTKYDTVTVLGHTYENQPDGTCQRQWDTLRD